MIIFFDTFVDFQISWGVAPGFINIAPLGLFVDENLGGGDLRAVRASNRPLERPTPLGCIWGSHYTVVFNKFNGEYWQPECE
ncbi:MAG: hypothetical protein DRR08_06660 [Candidatus Parabeggiatoa sp. nov. 2]|nr:MAG: hypothetical protein B6247_00025 [Beggiatoa sp. 4572_84]RKZ62197.1 MAG: hypothetical protein DRR08_06660 [Gammaproteobacteria bacterium]